MGTSWQSVGTRPSGFDSRTENTLHKRDFKVHFVRGQRDISLPEVRDTALDGGSTRFAQEGIHEAHHRAEDRYAYDYR
jgi:hypothetical protein